MTQRLSSVHLRTW